MLCGLAQDFSAATKKLICCNTLFARKASKYVNKGIMARVEEGCSCFVIVSRNSEIDCVYEDGFLCFALLFYRLIQVIFVFDSFLNEFPSLRV